MSYKKSTAQNSCPYWTKDSKKCLVCNGGLFIPLDDHIDVYCKSMDYPQCMQYSIHAEAHLELLDKLNSPHDNRRQYQRHPQVHKVTLVKLINTGDIVTHHSSAAETIDLSKGGMRINLDKPLDDDSVVKFSFDQSFPKILRAGTGQVQWCNKHIDEPGFQAGIAFKEDLLIEKMGVYLDIQLKTA